MDFPAQLAPESLLHLVCYSVHAIEKCRRQLEKVHWHGIIKNWVNLTEKHRKLAAVDFFGAFLTLLSSTLVLVSLSRTCVIHRFTTN
jgi:hypothetical protein